MTLPLFTEFNNLLRKNPHFLIIRTVLNTNVRFCRKIQAEAKSVVFKAKNNTFMFTDFSQVVVTNIGCIPIAKITKDNRLQVKANHTF